MGFAEQQWEALQNDDILLKNLTEQLTAKGIQPVQVSELPVDTQENEDPSPSLSPTTARTVVRSSREEPPKDEPPSDYEHAILSMMELRDCLVESFVKHSAQKEFASELITCIRKSENAIKLLGGTVESFDPLEAISGLATPPSDEESEKIFLANALRVAQNTKEKYSLYEISKMIVKPIKERPGVLLQIVGMDKGKPFVVNGQVIAKTDFSGNEAIDYVRDGENQRFTIKALRLGKWVDVGQDFIVRYKDVSDSIKKDDSQ